MGRELVMVPPNWDHPKEMRSWGESYKPMFCRDYEEARKEWLDGLAAWERGERESYFNSPEVKEFWDWYGLPPRREYYVPFKKDECTWFQVWETVSEGTPVTPAFPTTQELVEYLSTYGDFWDQKRGDGPWNRDQASAFVIGGGSIPSMAIIDGSIYMGRDIPVRNPA